MKKVILLLIFCLSSIMIFSQMSMYIQKSTELIKFPLIEMDSVTFTGSEGIYSSLQVHKVNKTTVNATLADIDNIYFQDEDIINEDEFVNKVYITYNGTTATITNPFEGAGIDIAQTGAYLVVSSTIEGVEYIVSGTTNNGSLKMYSDYKLKLTLNGTNITSTDGPAINIQCGKRIYVNLPSGTSNTLTDSNNYTVSLGSTEDAKGCFFSEGQLIFSGSGSLYVNANHKNAIRSDDYIRVIDGKITVNKAVEDGISANGSVIFDGGEANVTVGGDGIKCSKGYIIINAGTISINSEDEGIVASYDPSIETTPDYTIIPYITINGGTISINTTYPAGTAAADQRAHGIKTISNVTFNGGTTVIVTTGNKSDGINIDGTLTLKAGSIMIQAGDDCAKYAKLVDAGNILTCL